MPHQRHAGRRIIGQEVPRMIPLIIVAFVVIIVVMVVIFFGIMRGKDGDPV